MERILLSVWWFSGWHISTCLLHQYHFVADVKTWIEAQTYCRLMYTDLAKMENTDKMNQFINTVSSAGHDSHVWIGVYSTIHCWWSNSLSVSDYRNWKNCTGKEPYLGGEWCVNVGTGGGWWAHGCSEIYPFVCFKGTQLDPEFVVVNQARTWSSAQSYCRKHYIDLATVRNHTENQEVQTLVQSGGRAWIGLQGHPHIYSVSYMGGTNPNISWADFGSERRICAVTALQTPGTYSFLPCETRLPFVCYGVVKVRRQIVKLRMKLEDSSVNLDNPAVNTDLLKKLQDRLKEKGVRVSLKWRKTPDGKVFYKEGKPTVDMQCV